MKLLLIGGPRFLGYPLIEAALKAGHNVTTFNRGRTNPDQFPQVEKLLGDREQDLSALTGRSFDIVIDTCGYLPGAVRQTASLLAGSARLYVFISTISVYADQGKTGLVEEDELATISEEEVEKTSSPREISPENYGPLKALCEKEVQAQFSDGALIIRPGLIVGPYDPSDRFTYWVHRLPQGGEVLAPGSPARPVQFIDVRDLAEGTLRLAEKLETGVFNFTGPDYTLTMGVFLEESNRVCGGNAHLTWGDDQFILDEKIMPWLGLPLWIPASDPMSRALGATNITKALSKGLTIRPLAETVRATFEWDRVRPSEVLRYAGISLDKEREVLEAWNKK
ncbi:MAG: NAD-dependent epimerase/dehydratase family protein [Chloroflexi bacterium]|uniref:NAD-dependent epimerase/dehydratase family protein n=1 Tax=Candidatus Chlorohelix allophototropha TaxID=3003348 RepID=A0A8T7LRK9_9CHLR|nr:NAD-dependent epimerase/dehydratase family protein [Chloroflexota bacterium]